MITITITTLAIEDKKVDIIKKEIYFPCIH